MRTVEELKAGEHLGRYRLVQELGRGAAGLVFLAEDTLVSHRLCLKVLHPKLAHHPEAIMRFHREIVLARRIVHKGVCRVHDLHEADGLRFTTMELVPGVSLRELIRSPLPPRRAIRIGVGICEALAAAHKVGVVHRDLKPRNVMVRDNDDVVLLDFGIATALDVATGLTSVGGTLGTPSYIAPEVWEGNVATAKADQFAVGVVLFNMLTAKMPWSAPQDVMLYEAMLQAPAPAASALVPGGSAALDLIVRKALSFHAKDRFADLEALGRALASVPLAAEVPTRATRPAPVPFFVDTTEKIDLAAEQEIDLEPTLPLPSIAELPSLPPGSVDFARDESASWVISGQAVGPPLKTRPQKPAVVFDDDSALTHPSAPKKKRSRLRTVATVLLLFVIVAGGALAYLAPYLPWDRL